MGDQYSNEINRDREQINEPTNRSGETADRGTNTNPAHTTNTDTKTDTKRTRKRTTTKETSEPLKINSELPILEVTVPKSEQSTEHTTEQKVKNPKGAGRKPKTQSMTKKQADSRTIEMLLATVNTIISSKPNMEPFAFTEQEIKAISQPLANILNKYEGVANVQNEYADHILLITAIVTIIFPKVLLYQNEQKKKKGSSKPQNISKEGGTNERTTNASNQPNIRPNGNTNIPKTNAIDFHSILSPVI